jgi:hypothetical protein
MRIFSKFIKRFSTAGKHREDETPNKTDNKALFSLMFNIDNIENNEILHNTNIICFAASIVKEYGKTLEKYNG